MASTSSIGGLISGLDTNTLVSQLMQVAAAPQTRLKLTLTKTNAQITAAQAINTKAASMTSLAADLAGTALYRTAKATSSSTAVTATVTGSPASGSLSFTVTRLAATHSVATGTIDASATGDFTITTGTGTSSPSPITIHPASHSAADLVAAINGTANLGVTAQAITDSSNNQRIVLTAAASGAASAFAITGLNRLADGSDDTGTPLTTGQDAAVSLGAGLSVTSPSNTFSKLVSGVDVTVTAANPQTSVTVTTATDTSAISSKVSGLAASMNAVLGDISFHTKAPAAGVTASATNGSLLVGNSTMRDLSGQVLDAVSGRVGGDAASLAGLSVTRDGTVTFDATKFNALYTSDPAKAQQVLQAVGAAVQGVGKAASSTGTGSVTSLVAGLQSTTKDLTTRISDWDVKLTAKQATLKAQYDALETALQRVKSQGDSLTQALAGLTSSNSN